MTAPTIVRAVQTCPSHPSQWDAWTDTGQYLYLRYHYGLATVDAYDSPDSDTWTEVPDGAVASWTSPEREELGNRCYDGEITLEEFCRNTGLTLNLETPA